jgi:predicted DNA-binding transcriptional regulator YafY
VVVPIESVEHGVVDLSRYGPEVEVLAPPELRARMREAAAALSRLYGVSS